jgi:rhodanese-related sulfurtransferase
MHTYILNNLILSYRLRGLSMKKLTFITIERLLEMNANDEKFTLVDVLSEESYKDGHIPGAINIPLGNLESLAERYLDRKDTIVVYCGSYSCQASTKATRKLLEMGYENTLDFKAGKRGWQHTGLGLEK